MGNPHAIGNAYHITSDESMTWNQIYERWQRHWTGLLTPFMCHLIFWQSTERNMDFAGQLLGDKACTVLFDNTKIKRLCLICMHRIHGRGD